MGIGRYQNFSKMIKIEIAQAYGKRTQRELSQELSQELG